MNGEELYDAASQGDATKFHQLVEKSPSLVKKVLFPCSRNVLHVATLEGHLHIVEEVLKISRELALELDSKNSSPLHIAAAKGKVEIAKKLLAAAPEMCWCRDSQGLNPVHIAAMKGDDVMLELLLKDDRLPGMERVHRGQTVLHLCVKHHRLKALQFLMKRFGELVYAKDDDGETLLHWAVRSRQEEMVDMVVSSGKIPTDSINSMGRTAAQIYTEDSEFRIKFSWNSLKFLSLLITPSALLGMPSEELAKIREQTMVAMTLIAAMAFQAGGLDITQGRGSSDCIYTSQDLQTLVARKRRSFCFINSYNRLAYPTTANWGGCYIGFIHIHSLVYASIYCYQLWSFGVGHSAKYSNTITYPNHQCGRYHHRHHLRHNFFMEYFLQWDIKPHETTTEI